MYCFKAAAGLILAKEGFKFDIAYTSVLKRAIRTLWYTLEQTDCMYIPIVNAWQLNERCFFIIQSSCKSFNNVNSVNIFRHYGALQGLDKQETVAKYGKEQV